MKKNSGNRRKFLKAAGLGSIAAAGLSVTGCSKQAVKAPKKRIMVGRFSDETNTMINDQRTLDDVKSSAKYGADVFKKGGRMVHGTVGGCMDG
ncbi:MAG: twin-arginine translocation signal domain-containing protein, partial [Candidatus Latescibacteria bacterium]|nr:twin-arginine translocation signal domain-containing protein [Candidatus Latescibacterota bacterium]